MKLSDLFYNCAYAIEYQQIGDSVNYAFRTHKDTLYIYFEGSNSVSDWVRNFLFPAKPYHDMKVPYRVHRGFLAAWKEVEDIIIEKICEVGDDGNYKWKHIVVVGYSHGGALTFFTTECIWYHRPDLRTGEFKTYAFESPRVFGFFKIPKKLKHRWNNMTVVRVGTDLVTHCPPTLFGFCHAGTMLTIPGNSKLVTNKLPKCIKYHYPQVVYQALVDYENSLVED